MTNTTKTAPLLGIVAVLFVTGCGPEFDPASLVTHTRVVGARIEVEGAADRASPRPGETANVTWLVTSPGAAPPLGWTLAVCAPGTGGSSPACFAAPLARFDGDASPPRIAIPVPSREALGGVTRLEIYGGICAGAGSRPQFDRQTGLAGCTAGGRATSVFLELPLQLGDDANHNPSADRAFTLDGVAWPAKADDPCVQGPRVAAGSKEHVIGTVTAGTDRERYTTGKGNTPVAIPTRESLQISQFTTAGELKNGFSFVEAIDESPTTAVRVNWDAPEAAEVPTTGAPVTFTFVVRDDRGGTDWATRTLCVTR